MYLDTFKLPVGKEEQIIKKRMVHNGGPYGYIDNIYPCGIFSQKQLCRIDFERITILYGGNGSGKSTLLDLIANKLELHRTAPFNSSELFSQYTYECEYTLGYDEEGSRYKVPNGSRIIKSDDVFDYMLAARENNQDIAENIEDAREEWGSLKFGKTVKFSGMEDYEANRLQVLARSKSLTRRQFISRTAGAEVKLNSNGETALEYFDSKLKNDTLYCLDEPENSLSPKLQMKLKDMIEKMSRYCGCQFILATHSPFLLSLSQAKIYDLDETPVDIKKWWELENPKIYFDFFDQYRKLFDTDA
ncbi:MAG TPA: AAA family ATPase [Lachnospiraceae bacterium]|nr:AAA family ATPase [Lachnospiraceae bacterium]